MKAQQRAVKTYRKRLAQRGMARFEVLALDEDRDLIRDVAKRLAGGGSEASLLRAVLVDTPSFASDEKFETRNGVPLLPRRPGAVVTHELVAALRDEEF